MSQHRGFLLSAFPALSAVFLVSDGGPIAPVDAGAPEAPIERGAPALFSWGDVDGDGRLDLAAVSADGGLQLLVHAGDGRFEDVTERFGLAEVGNAAFALWADYDGDGRLDLFVGARAGASRLFHNEGGTFVDMSAGSGLVSAGAVQSAQWLDHDGDGRLDLFLVTADKSALFSGLAGGFFEEAELPFAGVAPLPGAGGSLATPTEDGEIARKPSAAGSPSHKAGPTLTGGVNVDTAGTSGGRIPLGPSPTFGGPLHLPTACAVSIRDQANPSTCIQGSTTPTLGLLYPLSANLFVAVSGDVGIGTTAPAAKLEVAGTARMTGTLTLAPGVDQALDVSTGNIYKGGALFLHDKGGANNTALGLGALPSVTTGANNTCSAAVPAAASAVPSVLRTRATARTAGSGSRSPAPGTWMATGWRTSSSEHPAGRSPARSRATPACSPDATELRSGRRAVTRWATTSVAASRRRAT